MFRMAALCYTGGGFAWIWASAASQPWNHAAFRSMAALNSGALVLVNANGRSYGLLLRVWPAGRSLSPSRIASFGGPRFHMLRLDLLNSLPPRIGSRLPWGVQKSARKRVRRCRIRRSAATAAGVERRHYSDPRD